MVLDILIVIALSLVFGGLLALTLPRTFLVLLGVLAAPFWLLGFVVAVAMYFFDRLLFDGIGALPPVMKRKAARR